MNQEEECLIDTTVEEQCKQQNKVVSPLLTEEGSGKEVVEEPQKPILKPPPTKLNPSTISQVTNSPLPVAPSHDPVYVLPSPTTQSTPKTSVAKSKASPSLLVQNLKKLVASVQTIGTTLKALAVAHTAWHSGWFGC